MTRVHDVTGSGSGRHCSPRHRMPVSSRNEGSQRVSIAWQAEGLADIARHVIDGHSTQEATVQNVVGDVANNICWSPPRGTGTRGTGTPRGSPTAARMRGCPRRCGPCRRGLVPGRQRSHITCHTQRMPLNSSLSRNEGSHFVLTTRRGMCVRPNPGWRRAARRLQ
jgi:hypothetical protein